MRLSRNQRGLCRGLFALVAVGALTGCGAGTTVFKTTLTGDATVPGDPSPLSPILNAFPSIGSFANMDFDQNQDFKNQGVRKEQVRSVTAESVTLNLLTPVDQDFSFLESLQFVARAGDDELTFAQKDGIADLGLTAPNPSLKLDIVKNAELQPYVAAPSTSIIVRGNGRYPPKETRLEAKVLLRVELTLF
jgi:hypothetical protein